MINFPDNPVVGQTYTFNNVTYTWQVDEYWKVASAGDTGPATSLELNAGVDNTSYATAKALQGSKYVREDETTGETALNHAGLERLKTISTGVKVTGQLNLDGDTLKGGRRVGYHKINTNTAGYYVNCNLLESLYNFDRLYIVVYARTAIVHKMVFEIRIEDLGDGQRMIIPQLNSQDPNNIISVYIDIANSTTLQMAGASSPAWTDVHIDKVYGILES